MGRVGRLAIGFSAAALCAAAGFEVWVRTTPLPDLAPPVSVEVQDHAGRLLRAWPVEDGRWRLATTRDDVDRAYLDRLIAYEDRRYHDHRGVDPFALMRAAGQALWHGRVVSGGSTLTMQVARLLEAAPTGTLRMKLRQIRLALALERHLSKDAILDLYLTLAPFGGNIEGIRAAAWTWFGHEPKGLTPAEAALLIALPQAPEVRRPDRHPGAARAARDRVLARIGLDVAEVARAKAQPAPAKRHPMPMLAAHAAERLRPDAGSVRLTLDAPAQAVLEALLREAVAGLPAPVSAALLAVDHATGTVRAAIGSPDPFDTARAGALDMTRAIRSPGSTLKPLIYGLGFESGLMHPETLIADRPADFGGYAPRNIDRGFQGDVTIRTALQVSLNVPAVAALEAVGPAPLLARLRAADVALALPPGAPPGLALALGGAGATLVDLVTLYAAIARGGEAAPLRWLSSAPPGHGARVLSPLAAWQVADVLAGTVPPAGATGAAPVAWKTGTAWGHRDAWAIGFDGRHTVGVWVGRADGGAVPGLMGLRVAAPLLFRAFDRLGARREPLAPRPAALPDLRHADLPPGLRRLGPGATETGPRLAYPPDGARVDLGLGAGPALLALSVAEGRPPFTWLIDGRPLPVDPFLRTVTVPVSDEGHALITVIDAAGAAGRVSVYLE